MNSESLHSNKNVASLGYGLTTDSDLEIIFACKSNDSDFYTDNFLSEKNLGIDFELNDSVKPRLSFKIEEDDDIQELFVAEKTRKSSKIKDKYFDNDFLVDINDVKKRWNIKTLADQNQNLSKSNYRRRMYGEKDPPKPRLLRNDIFLKEIQTVIRDDCQKNDDEVILKKRLEEIRFALQKKKSEFYAIYSNSLKNLNRLHKKELMAIQSTYLFGKLEETANQYYNSALKTLNQTYEENLKKVEKDTKKLEDALNTLFQSNRYKKGKLNEYTAFNIYQPKSFRKNFYDDGHRQLFCTVNAGKNILIEDELYNNCYGNPE